MNARAEFGKRRSALSALALICCAALAHAGGTVEVGQQLPDAAMRGLNGPSKHLGAFRGTPLIINVWASWCGPCRAEMASLERLAWRDTSVRFNIIGISTDDDPGLARAALESSHATIPHFIDSRLELETLLGANRVPLTVLVGADGRVIRKIYGAREWDSASERKLIDAAFGGAGPH
jgi:thiol-disulfide isomerase/thioredoxin